MRYFRHEVPDNTVTLYPFVCWHLGATQSDECFIREMIARVKDDPAARWVYMGDAGECVTKHSKGEIFHQTMDLTEQVNYFKKLVEPIKHKGLFGVRGNHGNRVFKETGLDFDDVLCSKVGIPYLGVSAFWHLVLKRKGSNSVCAFDIFTHHGLDSGATISSKVNKAKALNQLVMADAIFSAHSHICCEIPPRHVAVLADNTTAVEKVKWLTTHEYICGCAYDSRTGYAEDKGYSPILPAHLAVTFKHHRVGNTEERRQSCQIWRSETQ